MEGGKKGRQKGKEKLNTMKFLLYSSLLLSMYKEGRGSEFDDVEEAYSYFGLKYKV